MYINQFVPLAALPAIVIAASFDVSVGGSGLVFEPDHVIAAQGDLINFHFDYAPASIAQSTYEKPCVPSENGVWSGQVVVAGPTAMFYQINLTNTDPMWLYCAVSRFCSGGMAMVINMPASGETLGSYKAAAKSVTPMAPSSTHGGHFVDAAEASDVAASSIPSIFESAIATSSPTSAVGDRPQVSLTMSLVIGVLCVFARLALS